MLTAAIGSAATTFLIIAASHIRSDRTNRRPVVSWEGPFADYVVPLAFAGWTLSAAAIIAGTYALYRYRSRFSALAVAGVAFAVVNIFGSCLLLGIVYED